MDNEQNSCQLSILSYCHKNVNQKLYHQPALPTHGHHPCFFFKAKTASSSRTAIEPVNQSRHRLLVDVPDFRDECCHRVQVAHDQTVRSTRPRTSRGTQRRSERALRHSSLIPGFKGLLDAGQVDLDVSPWWQWRPRHAASTIAL